MKIWWLYARNKHVDFNKIGGVTMVIPYVTTRNLKGAPAYLPLGRHKCTLDAIKCAIEKGYIFRDDEHYTYRFTDVGIKIFI